MLRPNRDISETCEHNTARTLMGAGSASAARDAYRLGAADGVVGVALAPGAGEMGVGLWTGATSAAPPFWLNV